MIKFVSFSADFYRESDFRMRTLYREDGKASDRGKIQLLVNSGETIQIRPPTDAELGRAYKELRRIQNADL